MLFDIGGGSSELVRLGRQKPAAADRRCRDIGGWISLPLGVVTLAERHGGNVVSRETYEAMVEEVAAFVQKFARARTAAISTASTCSAPPAR